MGSFPEQQMTYIKLTGYGPPESLVPDRCPIPMPREGELLIKVAASGVNRPDVLQRTGSYAPPPGVVDILGLEVAGHVVAMGGKVSGWQSPGQPCGRGR